MTDDRILDLASRYASHDDSTDELAVFHKAHVLAFARALLAAGASEGQEPVAWITEAKYPAPRFVIGSTDPSDVWKQAYTPLFTHPSAEIAALREAMKGAAVIANNAGAEIKALRERIAGMEKEAVRLKELCKTLAKIMQDQTVAMQSAVIEWEFGKGAEAGLGWIVNTLEGPGNLPDPDAEHGKNAQFWFSANCAEPMPKCFCGNPSNTLWMGQGFCCREHYNEAKAKYNAAIAKEKQR